MVGGLHLLALLLAVHLDVAAERKGADQVLGLTPLAAVDTVAEAEGEFQHLHPEELGEQEMAEFMDEDKNAENEDEAEKGVHGDARNNPGRENSEPRPVAAAGQAS